MEHISARAPSSFINWNLHMASLSAVDTEKWCPQWHRGYVVRERKERMLKGHDIFSVSQHTKVWSPRTLLNIAFQRAQCLQACRPYQFPVILWGFSFLFLKDSCRGWGGGSVYKVLAVQTPSTHVKAMHWQHVSRPPAFRRILGSLASSLAGLVSSGFSEKPCFKK